MFPGGLVLALLLTLACQPDDAGRPGSDGHPGGGGSTDGGAADGGAADGGTTDGGGELSPLTGTAGVFDNQNNQFSAIVSITLDKDAEVRVDYGEGSFTHSTPPVSAGAGETVEVVVLGLRADRSFDLQAVATTASETWTSDALSYTTASLPVDWPLCTPSFTAPAEDFDPDEVTCSQGVTSTGRSVYHCTDYWGEPVFALQTNANDSLMSMRPLAAGGWASTSYTASRLLFFDDAGALTGQYYASYFADQTRFSHEFMDSHELIQITEGEWAGAIAVLTIAYEYFPDGSWKMGNGLMVIDPDTAEVLYDYSLHGELGDAQAMDERLPYSRAGRGDYEQDWTHANTLMHGLEADGREYLLLSLKAQDWILKLYPDSDELAWILGYEGDFTLVDDVDSASPVELSPLQWVYHQHGLVPIEGGPLVDPDDGRLHLLTLDNGYPRHDGTEYRWDLAWSRVVQLDIDQDRMLVDLDFSWGSEDPGADDWFFSSTCGNAVMTQGGDRVLAMDGENSTRIDISYPEGDERWRMTCETTEWCEYRVQWYPSLYETDWSYR